MVATVDRGFDERDFWSMEIAGERPVISSTSGFCIWWRNCRAYAESDSTYRRCPSAKMVSNAKDDFPLPESPVNTTILLRGISTVTSLRLWVRAPFTIIFSAPGLKPVLVVFLESLIGSRPMDCSIGICIDYIKTSVVRQ